MYVNKSFSINNVGQMDVATLKRLLNAAPDDAKVTVQTHHGDRWSMDYHSLTITWKDEV